MKRRMLSICLALALCLSLLPGTALAAAPAHLALGDSITTGYAPGGATVGSPFADQVTAGLGHDLIAETISDTTPDTPSGPAEEYDIWVGGTLVTSENAGDVLGNGTVAYDPDTNTLTLRDANITTPHEAGNYNYGIYAKGQLTIELVGDSTVGNNSLSDGVYMNGDLTITGTGSLNAVGSTTGVYVFGNMEVIDSTVTGTSAEHLGIVVWGELTVNGGKVTGTGNSASGVGIQVESSLTVNGGEVSGTGNIGIYTSGPLDMTAGTVTAEGANGYGLRVNNGSIQTDATSTVTATSVAGRAIYNSSIWVNRVEYELAAGVTEFRVAGGVVVTDAVQVKVEALYVNNEDVLTANNNTVTCGGGTAVYDPDTNTLTLRDANITTAHETGSYSYGIYAEGKLTIELKGQSTVGSNSIDYGVSMDGDLIITGTGSLTAAGSEKGIHVSDSLEVTGGTVAGTGENGAGVHVDGNLTVAGAGGKVDGTGGSEGDGIYVSGSLEVTGGKVDGTGGSEGDGIYVSGSLEVTGGTVTGTSTGGDGIRTEGYLAAYDNSTVSGEGNNGIRTEGYLEADDSTVSGEGNNDGIAAEGGLYVNYSIVTAQGATGCGLRASEILIGYFEDTSNVTASSQVAGRAVESSSIQVNSKEYTMAEGATEFKVVNGAVVAGAESVLLEALYVNNVDVLTAPGYTVQCGSGTAVYDSDTNTLTLRNATITEGYEVLYGEAPYGIYAKGKLTICLEGASTVVRENASFYYGVFMDGDLTITGSGSLTAKGSHAGISAENLTVTGGTVDGIGEDEYGIYTDGLTVNGGTLNGRGGFYGIRIAGNLTVNSGTVDGAGDSGIWITDGMTVNGGTVSGTGEEDYGIFADSLTVTGGTVTGKGDMVAIFGVKIGTGLAAGDIIVLPAGYLPAGYVLQAVEDGVRTYASIVPAGGQLDVNFEGTFSITGAAGEITLRAQQPSEPEWPSGGGSSGGSSTTTETQQNPDGSTTTTVTRPNGSTTETTRHPDGSSEVVETTKDGTVTTTTTDTEGNQTQVVENTDGSSRTTVDNQDGSGSVTTVDENGQVVSEATLSEAAVAAAHAAGEPVALPMPAVPVTTDRESAPTVTVNLPTSGSAKVEIPVKDVTPGTVAILIKADGTEEVLKASLPTENGVAVPLSDGDTVKLVDNSKKFADVPGSYWAADTIAFVTSRELFAGTTADTFAPDTAMSRAMIVTVLARLEGMDTATGDTWYEAGRQWAMASGVSDGTNMEQGLSRQQLATMLWRYAQAKGYDVSIGEDTNILSYTDAFDVAEYAIPAMQWAVGAGIINGTGDGSTLTPQGPATRAQVATMLMRFCEKTASW